MPSPSKHEFKPCGAPPRLFPLFHFAPFVKPFVPFVFNTS
jgi:hypothetical protein